MSKVKRGLGKGIGALLGDTDTNESLQNNQNNIQIKNENNNNTDGDREFKNGEIFVNIALIEPNKDQPRKVFKKEELEELSKSIKEYGVLQPLIVKKTGSKYEIIAGERRWRAANNAGLKEVPVVIRDYDEQRSREISI